ncbi:hypothetical protein GDI3695 [Gluconacetobacter diazotrophicus PA1 5]|uniref:Uncharacterized protein n=1 Tax=Gluconacetobacter diazotrophicus (strain ATCC 49037 / DSM 5601 / CCUG 37298 / CIP 103539 / LMG 7603 / PAl5) TaxID=272568 RepID=A9H7G9_GLUDA|nr:hypothetical protein GDI3695 [Gluconacetobacter diazotrophicus PA1 5]
MKPDHFILPGRAHVFRAGPHDLGHAHVQVVPARHGCQTAGADQVHGAPAISPAILNPAAPVPLARIALPPAGEGGRAVFGQVFRRYIVRRGAAWQPVAGAGQARAQQRDRRREGGQHVAMRDDPAQHAAHAGVLAGLGRRNRIEEAAFGRAEGLRGGQAEIQRLHLQHRQPVQRRAEGRRHVVEIPAEARHEQAGRRAARPLAPGRVRRAGQAAERPHRQPFAA